MHVVWSSRFHMFGNGHFCHLPAVSAGVADKMSVLRINKCIHR